MKTLNRDERKLLKVDAVISKYKSLTQDPIMDRKEWVHTGDYRNDSEHCRNHASLDRTVIPKDKPFILVVLDGITYYPMHPHDPVLPTEESDGCQCMVRGIVRDDVLGITYEERLRLQEQAIAELEAEDPDWEKKLDASNKIKSGYKQLSNMNILLSELEHEFSSETEQKILAIVDIVTNIDKLSTHQVSLVLKRLADCYYSHAYTKKALDKYVAALKINPKLSVKRRIKELESQSLT